MKIKHHELEIDKSNPFQNCKLDRKKYASILSEIVNNYSDGFVLAINNEWGTGKTTFVKMWQQHLTNENFQTVYFNAWENDFDNNPLVALMSELKTLTNAKNKAVFKTIVEKGAVLIKNIVPSLTKAVVKRYIFDVDEISLDTIENGTKAATEILEKEIEEYATKKKTIVEFRKELEKFIKNSESTKPLIYIIDELDRCRPNYAVEVLEQMKHFFSVPGIIFVLSIDKNHLSSSIKGVYGSEQINTDEYLRRFIDLEYSIPKPSNKDYCKYLFDYYSFDEFLQSEIRAKQGEFRNDTNSLLEMAEILFNGNSTTLRQQEKIFGQTRLILCSFMPNQYIFSHLLFTLIFIKMMHAKLYKRIENNSISLQELSNAFTETLSLEYINTTDLNLIYIQALLIHFYNNAQEPQNKIVLFETNGFGESTSSIKSKLEKNGTGALADCFKDLSRQRYNHTPLKFLLTKINLTDPLINSK